ncbi:MAG: SDR family NAD(P)-dependent oxidoreductase [Candidatus Actinomarina sp.]|tara:strand:- start:427 stop:1266 length:840 start_codon:yes stop_codon:yes gene_type:complete
MSKTAIITGANKGIGLAVAKDLIAKNYQVILACRDTAKGKMAEEFLGSNAVFLELDLSKPSSINHFVNQINSEYSEIDVLYNNAGLIYRDFELTEEGYESMIAVNYFGSFRLALMLLENLHRRSGRIVQVTSLSMYLARTFNLSDLHSKDSFSPSTRYNFTNLLRSMFAIELENKLKKTSISVSAVHPGVTKSRQSRPYEVKKIKKSFYTYFSTNINTGIAPIIRAIEDENITADLVYAPKLLGIYGKPTLMRYNKLVYNQELRDKLWSYTANELNLDI